MNIIDKKYFDIQLYVDEEENMYNPFDPTGLTFSNELHDYIVDCYSEKHLMEEPRLLITSETPIDQDRFQKAFDQWLESEKECNLRDLRINNAKMYLLLVIGVVFISIGIALSNVLDAVGTEFISVIGSFALWEFAALWMEEGPRRKIRSLRLERFKDMPIKTSLHERIRSRNKNYGKVQYHTTVDAEDIENTEDTEERVEHGEHHP